jgi:A/G-specific adenine glycosylase
MLSACGELVLFLNCCGRDVIGVFRGRVVEWFRVCGDRELPWRARSDGWAVLIAGVLLKRTTVKQVLKVYEEFLKRFPTPGALARASEDEVWLLLKPLGLRHRARQLIELARALVERFGDAIPCSFEELKFLPGVGSYTASEVMLRVCREPAPLLDTNTVRVVRRVFGIEPSRSNPYEDPTLLGLAKPRAVGALEFVLSMPVTRRDIYAVRFLAGVLTAITVSGVLVAVTTASTIAMLKASVDLTHVALLWLGLAISLIATYSLFYMLSTALRGGSYLAIAILAYILLWFALPIAATAIAITIGGVSKVAEVSNITKYINPQVLFSYITSYILTQLTGESSVHYGHCTDSAIHSTVDCNTTSTRVGSI